MRFEELRVWQEARRLTRACTELGSSMRNDAGLSIQMRRAAVSIVSNIAEGSNRGSDSQFRQFLCIARSSCDEVRAHLYLADDQGFTTREGFEALRAMTESVGRMLSAFIKKLQ
jgi:four helix bundle protein